MTRRDRTCALCGAERQETQFRIARLVNGDPGHEFTSLDRCVDVDACRARVDADPKIEWEVADTVTVAPWRREASGRGAIDATDGRDS